MSAAGNSTDGGKPQASGVSAGVVEKKRSHILGLVLLLMVSAMFVGTSFITQKINMPFFVSYFNNSLSSCYAIWWFASLKSRSYFGGADAAAAVWDAKLIRDTAQLAIMFLPLFVSMSFSFNWSLSHTSLTSNSVISTSSSLFAMACSYVILRSPFRTINFLGAVFTIAGVALVSICTDNGRAATIWGDLAALLSAFIGGLYTTVLKLKLTKESRIDMTLFFGFLGVFGALLLLPIVGLLQWTGVETVLDVDLAAFWGLLGNGLLTMISNFVWAKAIVLTTPFVATIGLGMTTPLTMIVDLIVYSKTFALPYYVGVFLVLVGYCIINIQHSNEDSATAADATAKPVEGASSTVVELDAIQ